ncbi:MAG: cysteine synthase A [Chitinivibrionales bacterium]|nr:cysteine synthase A [Chitinivibrionales bacterium]
MRIAESIADLVGNTPLVKIRSASEESGATIVGKLESTNPLSSVKDRIAVAMINAAEKSGILKKGGTIVEPTSGNTGIGLAFVAAARGYRLILTMPETMSMERRRLLKALGAELVLTPGDKGMNGAVERAGEIHGRNPGSFMPQQFENQANPAIHRLTTADEIWRDTEGTVDIFVAAIGTGGTITGCGEALKQRKPSLKVVAVEPDESAVLSGESPGSHRIQGIGAGFIPGVLNTEIYDEIIRVSSGEAAAMTRALAKKDGILAGISAGANVLAAVRVGSRHENRGKTIVTIICDTGERYLSTWIYADPGEQSAVTCS